jgi:predicted acylesterase/phospholipase RssA
MTTQANDSPVRLGLALSGGGFRASLFHIGVLARLAELDLLKHVAVLSTVSGGSIIGAHYYLKVKQLLEGKRRDGLRPCRDAYVRIVQEIDQDFLAGVQDNIRMRTFLDPLKNLRMLRRDYSRSDRIGELYTDYFYQPIWAACGETGPIHLSRLKIQPLLELLPASLRDRDFDIDAYNQQAPFKIPVLTINATCLNTGHPWEFTSSWVGEPSLTDPQMRRIDTHRRLERLRFDATDADAAMQPRRLSEEQQRRRRNKMTQLLLGDAVAASACVPGIFAPLAIHDLYWNSDGDDIVVQLVDGGVYDNQGLAGLFAAECTHVICSDASGQMEDLLNPSALWLNVVQRSNSILMDRARADGVNDLFLRRRGERLLQLVPPAADPALQQELAKRMNVSAYAFFHLKDEFHEAPDYPKIPGPRDRRSGMIYQLAKLRTDLDSFTDLEAYTLMYDGYCLSGEWIREDAGLSSLADANPAAGAPWRFLAIREELRARPERLHHHLMVGAKTAFKVFMLHEPLAYAAALVLVAVVLAILGCLFGQHSWWWGILALFITSPLIIAAGVFIHLKVFDRLFLRSGRIAS